MGKSYRTKGIKNRGSQIHENKKKKAEQDWLMEDEYDDIPHNVSINAISINSNRRSLDNA